MNGKERFYAGLDSLLPKQWGGYQSYKQDIEDCYQAQYQRQWLEMGQEQYEREQQHGE